MTTISPNLTQHYQNTIKLNVQISICSSSIIAVPAKKHYSCTNHFQKESVSIFETDNCVISKDSGWNNNEFAYESDLKTTHII